MLPAAPQPVYLGFPAPDPPTPEQSAFPPPPADVIVENTEAEPLDPPPEGYPPDRVIAPPLPTVIGKVVAVRVIPVGVAKGLAV